MRKGGDIAFIDKVIKSGEQEATGALRLVLGGNKEGAERLEKMRRNLPRKNLMSCLVICSEGWGFQMLGPLAPRRWGSSL